MSHSLELAQQHAWNLARTLMTTIVLFQSDAEYGVLPEDDLDDAEVDALYIYDPYTGGRSVH